MLIALDFVVNVDIAQIICAITGMLVVILKYYVNR